MWSIVPMVLEQAALAGARHAWLLTEGAAQVFNRLGFEAADRQDVPPAIGQTRQFRELCGESATLMHKPLERAAVSA